MVRHFPRSGRLWEYWIKMTDKEKLVALLKEWGVVYNDSPNIYNGVNQVVLSTDHYGKNSKVTGYSGFATEFTFDSEGKFVNIGIWE
jgi:hypothetical protein